MNGVKAEKPEELVLSATPFCLMIEELSAANWPVSTAVAGLKPVRSKVVR